MQIIFQDLGLTEEGRQLIFKGSLKKRGGGGESSDLQVFLFDHALLMVKVKTVNKVEQYKIHRKVFISLKMQLNFQPFLITCFFSIANTSCTFKRICDRRSI